MNTLNVYFWALYDAYDQTAHSGLICADSVQEVRNDAERNFYEPRFITVREIPELMGQFKKDNSLEIMPRKRGIDDEI